jgi:antitoxin ParD1/3/4
MVAMAQMNISMPDALKEWAEQRVAEGRYASTSDYMRDLVRRDQDGAADETAWLQAMIDEGRASEPIDKEPSEVIAEILAESRARRG